MYIYLYKDILIYKFDIGLCKFVSKYLKYQINICNLFNNLIPLFRGKIIYNFK